MPKRYRVKPVLRGKGRTFYSATFYNAKGNRVTRGLGTESLVEAQLICDGLVYLRESRVSSPAECPADVPSRACQLYWDLGTVSPSVRLIQPGDAKNPVLDQLAHLGPLPPETRAQLLALAAENATLKGENKLLSRQLHDLQSEHEALRSTVLAHAAEARKTCPPLLEALDLFEQHMLATTTRRNAKIVTSVARRLIKTLPEEVTSPAHVTANHVHQWLDEQSANASRPATRRDYLRRAAGRFLIWSAKRWGFPSVMDRVPAPKVPMIRRERGDIQWHSIEEVEAVLESLPDDYWKALVATLAYAGLQLAELVWLRNADLQPLEDGRQQLWITTVEDNGQRHDLKTGHRRRAIAVHKSRLWPRIQSHLEYNGAGDLYLFPMPPGITRRKRAGEDGITERWAPRTLSTFLLGTNKTKHRKKARPGLLPKDMTPKSLRRTFGSLLLRSGKSVEEVAAAMGNTPAVVLEHYARIVGAEVDIDF